MGLITTQEHTSAMLYPGTYLSKPFNTLATYPDSFDKFKRSRIGQVKIADIPSNIRESHLKIWKDIIETDFLTTPLSDSIKIAETLYRLRPHVNSQPGDWPEKDQIHHALVRLAELWSKFEAVLGRWGRTEVGAHADAADGLFQLEEARFVPVLTRFLAVLRGYGQPNLFEEMEEFVATSMMLIEQIENWLRQVGRRE